MKKLKLLPLLGLFFPILYACTVDDEGDINPEPETSFSATIGPRKFATTMEFVGAEFSIGSGDRFQFLVEAFDYKNINTGEGQSIFFSVPGDHFEDLKAGDELGDDDNALLFGTLAIYTIHTTFDDYEGGGSTSHDDFANIRVRITAIDKVNELISGEFSFVVYDDENDIYYQVTDGKFNNIVYTVDNS